MILFSTALRAGTRRGSRDERCARSVRSPRPSSNSSHLGCGPWLAPRLAGLAASGALGPSGSASSGAAGAPGGMATPVHSVRLLTPSGIPFLALLLSFPLAHSAPQVAVTTSHYDQCKYSCLFSGTKIRGNLRKFENGALRCHFFLLPSPCLRPERRGEKQFQE